MGRVMAIDYGRRWVGLAVCDELGIVARPLAVLVRTNRRADMKKLRGMIQEQEVRMVIVGHPVNMDGTRGDMAEEAERFAKRVKKECGVEVELVDERLTSWEANEMDAKAEVDAVAAAVMLREYLGRGEKEKQKQRQRQKQRQQI